MTCAQSYPSLTVHRRRVQWLEYHERLGVGRVYIVDHLSDVRATMLVLTQTERLARSCRCARISGLRT